MLWRIYQAWQFWDYKRRIRKYGWVGTYIPGDAENASLSYSAGISESIGAPEIVMFGMDPQTTSDLLVSAYGALKSGALVLSDKAECELGWWDGVPKLAWRAVHPSQIRRDYLGFAIWYREQQGKDRAGLEAYQLVVSDGNGMFPWEEGYDLNYRPRQPALYLPFDGAADDRSIGLGDR